jgi:hypothetical protein
MSIVCLLLAVIHVNLFIVSRVTLRGALQKTSQMALMRNSTHKLVQSHASCGQPAYIHSVLSDLQRTEYIVNEVRKIRVSFGYPVCSSKRNACVEETRLGII